VQACPPSAWYRFRKSVRRNKTALVVAALVLLFLAAWAGVAVWAALQQAKQHAAQRAALEADIGRDLDEARDFCRQDRLREARAVLDHAAALADRGAADGDLGERVAQLRKDVDMATRVEAIRTEKARTEDGHLLDWEGTARHYTDAFRDYGLDLDQLEPDTTAARIGASAIRGQIVAALDDWLWAISRPNQERLLAVLAQVDADPWRQRLRVEFVNRNQKALRELAREANAPAQPPANCVLLGGALRSLGDTELAVEFLRRAQQEHPGDYWLNQELGHTLMHLKSPRANAEAAGYFRAALALRPDNPVSLVTLAEALVEQGDLPGAVAACQKAIALKPGFATAHCELGFVLLAQGDLPGARAEFGKVIALEPDLAEGQWNMGNVLRRQGDLPGALAAYRKTITLKPNDAIAHCSLGKVLEQQGDLAGAVAAYQKSIALRPDLAEVHFNLANVLEQQGDLPGAVAAFQKAIALRPDDATTHNRLGIVLALLGDRPGAIAAFQKAIALKPDYAEVHYNLGMTLRDQGDLPGAIAAYRKAIALKPDHAMAHNNLGVALRDQGDLAGAVAAYRKAVALKPDSAEAHCNLGIALQQQGEFAKALEELRRGHEFGSKDPLWRHPSAEWVRQCQHLVELDRRLADILAGKAAPASATERIELAQLCAFRQRTRAALRFYQEAFAAQPTLLAVHRYNAACAAALAGCGRGQDVGQFDDKERAILRHQALEWLRADLEAQSPLFDKQPAAAAAKAEGILRRWLADPDFGGVREPDQLAKLPEAERPAWQRLWKDVADLLKQGQEKAAPEKK
jgi:tetratricopeptide (TPR) repeat protein